MDDARLGLETQVRLTKATALSSTTAAHMAAYGRAIMDGWAADSPMLGEAATRPTEADPLHGSSTKSA